MLEGVGVGGHHFNNGNNLVPSITFSVPSPSSIAVTTAPILGDYLANADINYPSPPTAAGFLTASDLDLINSIDFLDVPPFNNVGGNNDEDGKGVNAPPSSSSATPNTPTLQQHISAIVPPSSPSAAGAPVRRRTTKPRAYSASIYRPSTSSNSSNESNDSTNSSIPVAITSPALHQNVSLTRPFGCPQCPMAFTRKHDLTRHIKTHLGIRDFVCVDCDRSFGRNDALVRHRAGRCTAMHMYNPDVAPLN